MKSPLAPSRYPRNLIQCHLLRAHSPRIYIRSFPNCLCPIPEGMCFRKNGGGAPSKMNAQWPKNPLQITIRTPAGFSQTRLKFTFQRSFLHEYASDHSQLCCAYSSGHVLSKKVWVLDSKMYGYR